VSKANGNKQSDADNRRKQLSKDVASPLAAKKARRSEEPSPEYAETAQSASEIPKFDLAEQILAEQRKVASVRRKGPGKKAEAPKQERKVGSIGYAVEPPPMLSEQEQIVAEIVARDIEKLRRGITSSLQRNQVRNTARGSKWNASSPW